MIVLTCPSSTAQSGWLGGDSFLLEEKTCLLPLEVAALLEVGTADSIFMGGPGTLWGGDGVSVS